MNDMIERVAEALWSADAERCHSKRREPWSDVSESVKDDWRFNARAAIQAMREPTDEMVSSGQSAGQSVQPTYLTAESTIERWQAMVDTALSE